MNSFFPISDGTIQSMVKACNAFAESVRQIQECAFQAVERLSGTLQPVIEALSALYKDIDWEALAQGAKQWGHYGWVPPSELPLALRYTPPDSRLEADSVALKYLDDAAINRLFNDLERTVPKSRDVKEAISLFQEKRYKPAAMLTCSLIDGEMMKSLQNVDLGGKRRSSRAAICRMKNRTKEEGIAFVSLASYESAYEYFFKDADDFNRRIEGELNRNFLMHGMMYKPVRRKTCLKLFLLLRAELELLYGFNYL